MEKINLSDFKSEIINGKEMVLVRNNVGVFVRYDFGTGNEEKERLAFSLLEAKRHFDFITESFGMKEFAWCHIDLIGESIRECLKLILSDKEDDKYGLHEEEPEFEQEVTVRKVAMDVLELLESKGHDYGNAFEKVTRIYPSNPWAVLTTKICRINELTSTGKTPENESLMDTVRDMVGYGLMIMAMMENGDITN